MPSQHLDALKEQIKNCLPLYLAEKGIPTSDQKIRCISGTHTDDHPSMSLFANKTRLFCFACRASYDIFDAAHILDGYAAEGAGFIKENVLRLAKRYAIDIPRELDTMTEEEVREHNILRAYEHAARILTTSKRSELAEAYIDEHKWTVTSLRPLGVGSVSSHADYAQRMAAYGFDTGFLRSIDLLNTNIFNPDRLVFSVRDENGQVVGFAARNLKYVKGGNAGEKYYNTASTRMEGDIQISNPYYQKGRRLFGLHLGRRRPPPLYVFEGYGDAVTALECGLPNSCAIGGIYFTEQHLEMLFSQKIDHMIFCLDADESGNKATERFVDIVDKAMGNHPKIRIEILTMPEGSDDPDTFIRANGMSAFLDLEKKDVFRWRLERAVQVEGQDSHLMAEKMIPLIVNEVSNIERDRKIKDVAAVTGVSREFLIKEVLARVDENRIQAEEVKSSIALKFSKRLREHPSQIDALLLEAQKELEMAEGRAGSYDPKDFVIEIDAMRKNARELKEEMGLRTGWADFDKAMRGLPVGEAMISVPGKSHHGKTSLFAHLASSLITHNKNAVVLVHTMDDALGTFLLKMLASRSGLPIDLFRYEGAQTNITDEQRQAMDEVYRWAKEMANENRLVIAGSSQIAPNLASAAAWIRKTRRSMPSASIIYFGDNYHLYTDGSEGGDGGDVTRQRNNSMFLKNVVNETRSTVIASMELAKKDFGPGIKPRMGSIRGSGGMTYDSNVVWNVYNQLMDLQEGSANMVWRDEMHPEHTSNGAGESLVPTIKPVVELNIDKNKFDGRLGRFYFNFDPAISRFVEVDNATRQQYVMASMDEEAQANRYRRAA